MRGNTQKVDCGGWCSHPPDAGKYPLQANGVDYSKTSEQEVSCEFWNRKKEPYIDFNLSNMNHKSKEACLTCTTTISPTNAMLLWNLGVQIHIITC